MYLTDNPILQHHLTADLRSWRGFVLLAVYVGLLGLVVYVAWPRQARLDLTTSPESAQRLVNLFFLGQYVLLGMLVPPFAAGAFSGEKERKTYETLLASPLRPGVIVLGKLLAALAQLAVLVFSSLPIVVLCLPLGGMHPSEVAATYLAMAASVVMFGMVSLTASALFHRTAAALVVSYLLILPLAMLGVLFYRASGSVQALAVAREASTYRLIALGIIWPTLCLALSGYLFNHVRRRLLHPPDVAPDGPTSVDPDEQQEEAVGMVIRGDQFPDNLFAPKKRDELMLDGVNPVYDKELRSELFGQGTLMLRLVIQISMVLALPLMALCFFGVPTWAPWYVGYVVLFNLLVAPVFSAGTITSERERQTLDLLLCTTLSPSQILWGKLLSGWRVSGVLTSFLAWPILLAWALPPWRFRDDLLALIGYLVIVALASTTATVLATFCSLVSKRTSVAMLASYLILIVLYGLPLIVEGLAVLLLPDAPATEWIALATLTSPFAAAESLPLWLRQPPTEGPVRAANWPVLIGYVLTYTTLNAVLLVTIFQAFNIRWRVRA